MSSSLFICASFALLSLSIAGPMNGKGGGMEGGKQGGMGGGRGPQGIFSILSDIILANFSTIQVLPSSRIPPKRLVRHLPRSLR